MTLGAASFLLFVLATPAARADVIMPPPAHCPRGAIGASGHVGPHCMPTVCASDADCARFASRPVGGAPASPPPVLTCEPAGLCVTKRTQRGGWGHGSEHEVALGSCGTDADCPSGVACEVRDRCIVAGSVSQAVPPELVPPLWTPPPPSGCARSGAGAGIVVLLAMGVLAFGVHRARRTDRARAAARALLESRGRATHIELAAIAPDVSRALAPLADRIRVDADDGTPVYVLEEDPDRRARRRQ